jgi:phage baseplate assembly protein W
MTLSIDIPNCPYWQSKASELGEVVTGIYDIAQSIETILTTLTGSVPLMPRFGFDALAALGKPLYSAMRKLERMAIEAFYWEPRAEILAVKAAPVSESSALLCLTWRPVGAMDVVIQVVGL